IVSIDERCLTLFVLPCSHPLGMHTLSLPDALPISQAVEHDVEAALDDARDEALHEGAVLRGLLDPRLRLLLAEGLAGEHDEPAADRKSTRLNSSHVKISYAGFCLKNKNYPAISIR